MRIFVAYRDNAAAYYRLMAPFSVLRYRTEHEVAVGRLSLDAVAGYDVLWLQMHADPTVEIIAREFQNVGGLVVYDVDDWLFELPPSWPAYDDFFQRGSGRRRERLYFHERIIALSDVVTCTTEVLKANLHRHFGDGKRIEVLPNCILQGDWDTIIPQKHQMPGPVVGWFGTGNHWDDWTEIVDQVEEAIFDLDGYLAVIGAPELVAMFSPWLASRTLIHPLVSWDRLGEIRDLIAAFDVGLAWCTNRFQSNLCRSPLKAIQYGAAGVPVVVSECVYGDLWQEHKCIVGASHAVTDFGLIVLHPDGLRAALTEALNNAKPGACAMAKSWQQEVWKSHSYERQALKWLEVLS